MREGLQNSDVVSEATAETPVKKEEIMLPIAADKQDGFPEDVDETCLEANEEELEFTHGHVHIWVGMAAQQFLETAGMPDDFFDDVASAILSAFPCPTDFEHGKLFLSRSQVRRLLDLTAKKCIEHLSQEALRGKSSEELCSSAAKP